MLEEAVELARDEFGVQFVQFRFPGIHPVYPLPSLANPIHAQDGVNMLLLGYSHRRARLGDCDRHSGGAENRLQCGHRGSAPVVDHGSRPIEYDSLYVHIWMPICFVVRSANPNDSVMPEPPTPVRILTPGAGSASKNGLSGCWQ